MSAPATPSRGRRSLRTATPRDNLYVCSILAVSSSTGELKWHYQVVPGDIWDFDSVQQLMLADLTINGRSRKVIMQANKNGFYYVIDRLTGAVHFGGAVLAGHVGKGHRPEDRPSDRQPAGAVRHRRRSRSRPEAAARTTGRRCRSIRSPVSSTFPPRPHNSWTYQAEAKYNPRPGMMTGTVRPMPAATVPPPPAIGPEPLGDSGPRGALVAWDPVAQQMRWRQPGGGGIGGGTLTTAGNLVFQVVNDGRLLAYSADKGEKLLEIQTGLKSGMGPPITYRLDGKQYHRADGRRRRGGAGRQRGPWQSADGIFTETPHVHPRRFVGVVFTKRAIDPKSSDPYGLTRCITAASDQRSTEPKRGAYACREIPGPVGVRRARPLLRARTGHTDRCRQGRVRRGAAGCHRRGGQPRADREGPHGRHRRHRPVPRRRSAAGHLRRHVLALRASARSSAKASS